MPIGSPGTGRANVWIPTPSFCSAKMASTAFTNALPSCSHRRDHEQDTLDPAPPPFCYWRGGGRGFAWPVSGVLARSPQRQPGQVTELRSTLRSAYCLPVGEHYRARRTGNRRQQLASRSDPALERRRARALGTQPSCSRQLDLARYDFAQQYGRRAAGASPE